jgi:hypothetical protein
VIPSRYGFVRGYTRTWHLIEAPLSTVRPWRDPRPTHPALCGLREPAGLGDWGTVCGGVYEGAPVCRRCVRKALRPTRGTA